MSATSMADRLVFITGGTGGVGLEVARALRARGAEIIIGSRDRARYASAAAELGGVGVHPFVADITDFQEVERQLDLMRAAGLEPTDVVHAAAGGLEPVLRTLARLMTSLKNLQGADRDRAHAAAREELAPIVAESRDLAMTVNYNAPSKLLDMLVRQLPNGGTVIYYISVWTSFYPHSQVPIYYQNIAESKHEMECWLEMRAKTWAAANITTGVISSTWIGDTRIGQVLDRFCAEPLPAAERERWRGTYVTCSEISEATLGVFARSRRRSTGEFVRLFLTGPGTVLKEMGPDDAPMQYPVVLAINAPSWSQELR
jgi:NAD(P)-dependent dehydrogenase (short-subunit alcohol dehydrogenase family)